MRKRDEVTGLISGNFIVATACRSLEEPFNKYWLDLAGQVILPFAYLDLTALRVELEFLVYLAEVGSVPAKFLPMEE